MSTTSTKTEAARAGTIRVTFRMLARALPGHGRGLILGMLFVLLTSGAALLQPWPLKVVLDSVIGSIEPSRLLSNITAFLGKLLPFSAPPALALLTVLCLGLLLIEIVIGVSHVVSAYLLNSVALKMVFKLRCALFDHVQRQSMSFHDTQAVGDSLYRITWDSYCIQAIFSEGLIPALTAGTTLLGIALIMLARDWRLTVTALAVSIPLMILMRRMDRPMTEQSLRVHENESAVSTRVQETLVGIRAVQAFGREEFESGRFRDGAKASLMASLRLIITQTLSQALVGLVLAVGTAAVIWIGARGVLLGRLTAGDLVLLVAYVAMIFKPLETLAYTAAAVQNAAAGARRVLTVLEASSEVEDQPGAEDLPARVEGRVSFEKVQFRYRRGPSVLKEIDFQLAPDSTVALVGPSGAGKTTLASLLLRFYDPVSGRVTVDGRDLRKVTLKSLRNQIALVTQDPILFAATIRENIAYGKPGAAEKQIEEAAGAAGAHGFIESLPQKYDTLVGERGSTLSSGQRQRISIARAFLKDAPILLLDEATAALDSESEEAIREALSRLMRGRTVIAIAHRLATLRNFDRVVMLQGGKIIEDGPPDILLQGKGPYRELVAREMDRLASHAA